FISWASSRAADGGTVKPIEIRLPKVLVGDVNSWLGFRDALEKVLAASTLSEAEKSLQLKLKMKHMKKSNYVKMVMLKIKKFINNDNNDYDYKIGYISSKLKNEVTENFICEIFKYKYI